MSHQYVIYACVGGEQFPPPPRARLNDREFQGKPHKTWRATTEWGLPEIIGPFDTFEEAVEGRRRFLAKSEGVEEHGLPVWTAYVLALQPSVDEMFIGGGGVSHNEIYGMDKKKGPWIGLPAEGAS